MKETMVGYYRKNNFNPVPIAVSDKKNWEAHVAKRFNLYQRHLGVPLSLLEGKSVLEFGCNSGENALVLAQAGAQLTLVEPNEQVIPRLKENFRKHKLEKQISKLINASVQDFKTTDKFDLVIAEGFLYTLSNRDKAFLKMMDFIKPGGLGVMSFNDPYGNFIELIKRFILCRACQVEGIKDVHSPDSLRLAMALYNEDFKKLNASRPFEAWWKDMLVSPFFSLEYLWTFAELFALLDKGGCQFYRSSPQWSIVNHFSWYKNVPDNSEYHKRLLEDWKENFIYFLTGLQVKGLETVSQDVVSSVKALASQISEFTRAGKKGNEGSVIYPLQLDAYFRQCKSPVLQSFNMEMNGIFDTLQQDKIEKIISVYKNAKHVRQLWGTAYYYISYGRLF